MCPGGAGKCAKRIRGEALPQRSQTVRMTVVVFVTWVLFRADPGRVSVGAYRVGGGIAGVCMQPRQ